jgi:tetratricopeptide (TPR) repeat protein
MNKKVPEEVEENGVKANKGKALRAAAGEHDPRSKGNSSVRIVDDPRFAQAVQNYEAALKAMQAHKYDKAKSHFEKVVAGASPELADRALVHLTNCNQQMSRASTNFKTAEEQFDYAVSLMNMGDYVSARENFDALTTKFPKLDYIWYGLAALNCLTGRFPEAIANLGEAIRLNPSNRYQARNDSDFRNLADDPRFTELLYPDTSAEAPGETPKWRY